MIALTLACSIYDPDKLQLFATDDYHVTSTTPSDNFFYDETSNMTTTLDLRNCTLYKRFDIGIVKEDSTKSKEGYQTLLSIFDELNDAYKLANEANGFSLNAKIFANEDKLVDYVTDTHYHKNALCFAIEWNEYNVEESIFSLNIRMNYGDIWATRKP